MREEFLYRVIAGGNPACYEVARGMLRTIKERFDELGVNGIGVALEPVVIEGLKVRVPQFWLRVDGTSEGSCKAAYVQLSPIIEHIVRASIKLVAFIESRTDSAAPHP